MIEKKLNGTIVKLKTKYIKQYTINNKTNELGKKLKKWLRKRKIKVVWSFQIYIKSTNVFMMKKERERYLWLYIYANININFIKKKKNIVKRNIKRDAWKIWKNKK